MIQIWAWLQGNKDWRIKWKKYIIILLALKKERDSPKGVWWAKKNERVRRAQRKDGSFWWRWMRAGRNRRAEAVRVQIREMTEMQKEAMDTQFQIGEKHREMRTHCQRTEWGKIKPWFRKWQNEKTQPSNGNPKLELIKLLTRNSGKNFLPHWKRAAKIFLSGEGKKVLKASDTWWREMESKRFLFASGFKKRRETAVFFMCQF